ncbi:MAG TPA: sodium-dependent transporter [Clostridiales bacterium]|nr:sodium-dependent transporter [Clostridiales bacterium]
MEKSRSSFSGKIGFVMAAAGSAVGLGNIWRFPYLAAKYGGGMFLLVYIIIAVTFGFTLMTAEIALGRKTGLSVIGAYKKLNKKYAFIGWLSALVPVLIFSYYCVIGGWILKYFAVSASNNVREATNDTFFTNFISQIGEPIFWFALFLALTSLIVLLGVQKGIERASKVIMPALIVLSVIITIFVVTREGALEGVLYYITPNLKDFNANTVLAAMGQLFYSMSLAMGIMVTYGSYMKRSVDLEKSVKQIEIFDIAIAFVAGLMIVPSVFIFSGGDTAALSAGPSLMFITMPKVFNEMWMGGFVSALFFLLVFFAALTSAVSLMETVVSIISDKLKIGRNTICVIVFVFSLIIGIPCSLGFGAWDFVNIMGMTILDFFDFISNNILMPIVAFLTCIFVGYVIKPKTLIDEVKLSSKFKREKLFTIVIKYVAPFCILAILATSILDVLGVLHL